MDSLSPFDNTGQSWADVERAALHDPALHLAVTIVRHGATSREQALICAVLWFSRERRAYMDREIQRLMSEPTGLRVKEGAGAESGHVGAVCEAVHPGTGVTCTRWRGHEGSHSRCGFGVNAPSVLLWPDQTTPAACPSVAPVGDVPCTQPRDHELHRAVTTSGVEVTWPPEHGSRLDV